jgi:hypothetical protein
MEAGRTLKRLEMWRSDLNVPVMILWEDGYGEKVVEVRLRV